MILVLDPSSTRTGYAILDGDKLVEAGAIVPARQKDPANVRIRAMAQDIAELVTAFEPTHIVIEDTSGKVGKRHGGAGAGLAVYGKAVGYLLCKCERLVGVEKVTAVKENDWTRGESKRDRQQRVRLAFKNYDPSKDAGGDVSDAIALGLWWTEEQKLRAA